MAIMNRDQFNKWRTAAKKPKLTPKQVEGHYQAYVKTQQAKAGKKPPAPPKVTGNQRPDGWALEGWQVTDANRHKYPEKSYEVVDGRNDTKWARPRTELTGIDPELRGMVKTFDDETGRTVGQVQRVYDALGARLTSEAQASTARLGGLADLAAQSVPQAYQSAGVSAPTGNVVQPTSGGPIDILARDGAAAQQRMLLRDAALDVNTANIDAQQAPLIGAREVGKLKGERSVGRGELIKGLVMQSRADAAAARTAEMSFLGKQLDAKSSQESLLAKLTSQEKIAGNDLASRERMNTQDNVTTAAVAQSNQQAAANRQAATDAKGAKKDAAAAAKANAAKKSKWIGKAKNYVPDTPDAARARPDVNGKPSTIPNALYGRIGGSMQTINGQLSAVGGMSVRDFYNSGVTDGVKPVDMIQVLRTAGVQIGSQDVYALLKPFYPNDKGARAATKLVTGQDPLQQSAKTGGYEGYAWDPSMPDPYAPQKKK